MQFPSLWMRWHKIICHFWHLRSYMFHSSSNHPRNSIKHFFPRWTIWNNSEFGPRLRMNRTFDPVAITKNARILRLWTSNWNWVVEMVEITTINIFKMMMPHPISVRSMTQLPTILTTHSQFVPNAMFFSSRPKHVFLLRWGLRERRTVLKYPYTNWIAAHVSHYFQKKGLWLNSQYNFSQPTHNSWPHGSRAYIPSLEKNTCRNRRPFSCPCGWNQLLRLAP